MYICMLITNTHMLCYLYVYVFISFTYFVAIIKCPVTDYFTTATQNECVLQNALTSFTFS